MQVWEYTILVVEPSKTFMEVQEILNESGRDGWEHYLTLEAKDDAGTAILQYFFKRPE